MAAAAKQGGKSPSGEKIVADNKKAFREYEILERLEAGIELRGTEVKSLRAGQLQMTDAYVRIKNGEAYLLKLNIGEYAQGNWTNHKPTRERRLLLHKREIRRLRGKMDERGLTIVPLKVYFNARSLVKVEIGLGRGKKLHDKRSDMKKKQLDREAARAMRRG